MISKKYLQKYLKVSNPALLYYTLYILCFFCSRSCFKGKKNCKWNTQNKIISTVLDSTKYTNKTQRFEHQNGWKKKIIVVGVGLYPAWKATTDIFEEQKYDDVTSRCHAYAFIPVRREQKSKITKRADKLIRIRDRSGLLT